MELRMYLGRLPSLLAAAGLVLVSAAALPACGTDSGGGTTTPADTTNSDTSGDTGTADTTGGGDSKDNAACCAAKNAECGFVAGCSASCGGCPTGNMCNAANKCVEKEVGPEPAKFGEPCDPDFTCPIPGNDATDADWAEHRDCLDNLCEDGVCAFGVCTKTCTTPSNGDTKINASGANGQDGVADEGVDDGCEGATDGPAGASFKCTQWGNPAQGQNYQVCTAGTTFKDCKANSDCPSGEVCGYKYLLGAIKTVCAPAYKNNDGSAGAAAGELCNDDPEAGAVKACANNLCGGNGSCLAFCKTNTDCTAGNECKTAPNFFGEGVAADICQPKPCELDEECPTGQFCRSYYNQAESDDGSPDPEDPTKVIYPAFTGGCSPIAPGSAKEGEKCDPYPNDDDETLPDCYNPYWCLDGVCGGHCKKDSDCAASQKCTVVEIPLDLDDPQDGTDDVYAPIQVCRSYPAAKGDCYGQGDCKGDASAPYCRMIETVDLAAAATKTQYTQKGLCIAPEAGYADAGALCGSLADGTQCKSGLCGFGTDLQPGFCLDMCSGKADCPSSITIGQTQYKMICRSYLMGWNGTAQPLDDLYAPLCVPAESSASLSDCSATKKCSGSEVCGAFPIVYGPTKAAKVEYWCVGLGADEKPTKNIGEVCNPDSETTECLSGVCMPDSTSGKGYCSAYCNADADCGTGNGLFCDTAHQSIGRADASKAAIVPMCLKKKSCIPCAYDYQCATGTACTWKSKADESGRCAPPCESDADCAGTDGGAKCEAQNDYAGKPTGKKVCTPTCN